MNPPRIEHATHDVDAVENDQYHDFLGQVMQEMRENEEQLNNDTALPDDSDERVQIPYDNDVARDQQQKVGQCSAYIIKELGKYQKYLYMIPDSLSHRC